MFTIRVFFLVGILALSACSSVQPWEKGNLAKEEMAWKPDPMEAKLLDLIYYSKEGSRGGGQAAGGGCGCN